MKNILVCNQKGGVGKSLVADELAFAFERAGVRTNFYNLDPQGGTLHKGVEVDGAHVAVIDTPGVLTDELEKWLKSADLVVVPTRPTGRDVATLLRMREILRKSGLPVLYVVNGCNRWKACRDFCDWVGNEFQGEMILQIPQSEAFVQSVLAEKSVVEVSPQSQAAQAIKDLFDAVREKLEAGRE